MRTITNSARNNEVLATMDPKGINSTKSDPVTKYLGKDIASLVYQHLWKIQMCSVNAQYRKHLRLLHYSDEFDQVTFGVLIWFNYRHTQPSGVSRIISHYVCRKNGWCVGYSVKSETGHLPANY